MACAFARGAALALWVSASPAVPAAETERYPARAVRIVVSFPAGGAMDSLARALAPELARGLGELVVVENRPGATGSIGLAAVARSAPDGYTIAFASVAALLPSAAAPAGELMADLTPVTRLVTLPVVIACTPSLPVTTLAELIALARREPGKLAYATNGVGTTSHLLAVALSRRAGIELVHVPYGGNRPFYQDVLSGEVPVLLASSGGIGGLVRSGAVRALAVGSARRSPALAEVPTVAEQGFPGFEMVSWYGAFVPVGTPHEIVDRLHREFARALDAPAVRERLAALGMDAVGTGPSAFAGELRVEAARWSALARDAAQRP